MTAEELDTLIVYIVEKMHPNDRGHFTRNQSVDEGDAVTVKVIPLERAREFARELLAMRGVVVEKA